MAVLGMEILSDSDLKILLGHEIEDIEEIEEMMGEWHFGFVCNECDDNIFGIRYNCSECEDYDLCSDCMDDGSHPKHRNRMRKFTPQDTVKMFLNGKMPPTQAHLFKEHYSSNAVPPKYWTQFNRSKSLKDWNAKITFKKVRNYQKIPLPPSSTTFQKIAEIVESTWDELNFGKGRDASKLKDLNYTKLEVINVERIENPQLFEVYAHKRACLFNKAMKIGPFKKLENIDKETKGPIKTTLEINGESDLALDVYPDINEHYFFHGTRPETIEHIATQGLDCRLTERAMFGAGVYCAESSTKSDQYADPPDNRTLGKKYMLLLRVCLGEIYIEESNKAKNWKRPPCKKCFKDVCPDPKHNTGNTGYFDSIVNDSELLFREFIVYEKERCYPEYIITYKRV